MPRLPTLEDLLLRLKQTYREKDVMDRLFLQDLLNKTKARGEK